MEGGRDVSREDGLESGANDSPVRWVVEPPGEGGVE